MLYPRAVLVQSLVLRRDRTLNPILRFDIRDIGAVCEMVNL